MRVKVYFVAETLNSMAQQSAMIRPCAASVAAALQSNQYEAALQLSDELHRSLKAFVDMSARVKKYVAAHDGLGEFGHELGELALRARSLVITKYLDYLLELFQQPGPREVARDWFGDRLSDIVALRDFINEKLRNIHSKWLMYRAEHPQPGMLEAEQTTTLRLMVRAGQRQLSELRSEPDVARFLANGVEATSLPDVQLACRHIDIVLGVEIDVGPSRLANPKRVRIGTPPGVPEQRWPREQMGEDRD